MRFVVFGSLRQAVKREAMTDILMALREHGAQLVVEPKFARRLADVGVDVSDMLLLEDESFMGDFAISIGGDGTLLRVASRLGDRHIPIVGVHMGRLGFLADVVSSEIRSAVMDLYEGRYTMESHTVLSVVAIGDKPMDECFALNDVAILKRDNASMINIAVSINGERMATYRADGLIVATPTGSTAYNLSNGGPIMASTARTLCLTAVAPHSLNLRPVVIDEESVVCMKVESRSQNFLLAVDGRSTTLPQGSEIVVRKAPYTIETVKLENKHYFDTLRKKMMWAADPRE